MTLLSANVAGGSMRRGVQSLLARHVAGFAINFLGTLVLARTLGPHVWGIFGVALVAQIILQGFLERGMVGYLVRANEDPAHRGIGTALTVQCAAGLVLGTVLIGLAGPLGSFLKEESVVPLLVAVGLSLPVYAIRAVPMGALERSLRYERVGIIEVLDLSVFNAVAVATSIAGVGLVGLAVATIARAVVSTVAAWLLAGVRLSLGASLRVAQDIAAFALPYSGSNLLVYLNGAAAPLIVGGFVGAREFGVLQLAYSLIAYPLALNQVAGRVSLPAYARSTDMAALSARVSSGTGRMIRYVGGATLLVAASSPLWVPLLYGQEWVGMSPIMLSIAPVFGIGAAWTLITSSLNAVGRTWTVLAVNVAFSLTYWTTSLLLVPRIGPLGLPIAYALASATFLWYLRAHRRAIGPIHIRPALLGYAAISAVLIVVAALTAPQ